MVPNPLAALRRRSGPGSNASSARSRSPSPTDSNRSGGVGGHLARLWQWGGDAVRIHGRGLSHRESSETHIADTSTRGNDGRSALDARPEAVVERSGTSVIDVKVNGATKDGGVRVNYHQQDLPTTAEGEATESDPADADDDDRIGNLTTEGMAALAVQQEEDGDGDATPEAEETGERPPVPPLSIVIMVAGTRGDVQPFISLGLKLKEYGHRVRLASHQVYREFVTGFGLEFYPLGGDPKVLSDFIVENRGIFPHRLKSATDNIEQVNRIVKTTYAAATLPDVDGHGEAFLAQAIIANPPVYAHLHVAEKLGIPCHIFFTMPWSPTRAFPSPLARFDTVADPGGFIGMRNFLSYWAVEDYMYIGLRSTIRRFRKTLDLPPLRAAEGTNPSHLIDFHKVPFGYCWSPSIVPKPPDWGAHIDVCGYFTLAEGRITSYQPPQDLSDFLAAGPPPVYIGFGSLIIDNEKAVTGLILGAARRTGQRIILSSGWGGLGEGAEIPPEVLLLGAAPHDWLLPRCSAVVHHGGAGTTAAGLMAGCPTCVVYFFGDQPFWGSACHRRGVGPPPIAIDRLTEDKLVSALEFMAQPDVKAKAEEISVILEKEDGAARGVEAFHRHLPLAALRGEKVVWNLVDPPQRSAARKAAASAALVIRVPTRAGIECSKFATLKGYRATSQMGRGLWSLMVLQPAKALCRSTNSAPAALAAGGSRFSADTEAASETSSSDGEESAAISAAAVATEAAGPDTAAALLTGSAGSQLEADSQPSEAVAVAPPSGSRHRPRIMYRVISQPVPSDEVVAATEPEDKAAD